MNPSPTYSVMRGLEDAPNDPDAFWKFAAVLCAGHAPLGAAELASYETDLRIVLRLAYCCRFDAPDDQAAGRLVNECIGSASKFEDIAGL